MANRAYFVNHAEKTPVSLDNQRGNWLLAASYQIPVLWLAMFSDADLTTVKPRVQKADGKELPEELPTLTSSTEEAVRRYLYRIPLRSLKIPQNHLQHVDE